MKPTFEESLDRERNRAAGIKEMTPMEPTLQDFIYALAYGKFYFSRNPARYPFWDFGWSIDYYDGWHLFLHCGPFSAGVSTV